MSFRQAAGAYGMSKSVIHRHVHEVVTQESACRPRLLSELEETVIVRCYPALASFGYSANQDSFGRVISQYLHECGRKIVSGLPGRKWWAGFPHR